MSFFADNMHTGGRRRLTWNILFYVDESCRSFVTFCG